MIMRDLAVEFRPAGLQQIGTLENVYPECCCAMFVLTTRVGVHSLEVVSSPAMAQNDRSIVGFLAKLEMAKEPAHLTVSLDQSVLSLVRAVHLHKRSQVSMAGLSLHCHELRCIIMKCMLTILSMHAAHTQLLNVCTEQQRSKIQSSALQQLLPSSSRTCS